MPFKLYALGGLVAAAFALALMVTIQRNAIASLRTENARLIGNAKVMQLQLDQAASARDVARAEAKRFQARSRELDAIREAILRGEEGDTPIDPAIRRALDRLRGTGTGSDSGEPEHTGGIARPH